MQLYDSNLDPKEIEKAKAGQKQDYPTGIPECGTDAMRFALCAYMSQGRDINLNIQRVQGYRFFCNKLWNASKFALLYFNDTEKYDPIVKLTGNESNVDLWILSQLAKTIDLCNTGFKQYELAAATTACYNFWLYELCDVYLECLKPIFQAADGDDKKASARKTLYTCLELGLKLISPFMPFISEELFQRLPRAETKTPSICVAEYPETEKFNWRNEQLEKEFEFVQRIARIIRSARSDYNLPNKIKTDIYVVCSDPEILSSLDKFNGDLLVLSFCSTLKLNEEPPAGCAILTISDKCVIHVLLKGLIEVDKEISKLEKKQDTLSQTIGKLGQAIADPTYATKVPEEIRLQNTEKMSQSEGELERVIAAIATLKTM
jgi:valyl-tRNA synthetase